MKTEVKNRWELVKAEDFFAKKDVPPTPTFYAPLSDTETERVMKRLPECGVEMELVVSTTLQDEQALAVLYLDHHHYRIKDYWWNQMPAHGVARAAMLALYDTVYWPNAEKYVKLLYEQVYPQGE